VGRQLSAGENSLIQKVNLDVIIISIGVYSNPKMEGQFRFSTKVQKVMRIFEGPWKSIQQDLFPRVQLHVPFNEGRNGGA